MIGLDILLRQHCGTCLISYVEMVCGDPSLGLENASHEGSVNLHYVGQSVSFYCNAGCNYNQGNEKRTCQSSGSWSGHPLMCNCPIGE